MGGGEPGDGDVIAMWWPWEGDVVLKAKPGNIFGSYCQRTRLRWQINQGAGVEALPSQLVSRFMPIVSELSNLPRHPLWENALQHIMESCPGVRLWGFLPVIAAVA